MIKIRCVVERITYQNPENGYSVLKCRLKGYSEPVPVIGNMIDANVGSVLIAESWARQKEVKNIMLFLQEHQVSASYVAKIYKQYGNDSITLMKENPYKLTDAIRQAATAKVMVLTGGPGTGKTTTPHGIIAAYRVYGLRILHAAPTGRTAKRMTEATGLEAKTIHRLLECKPLDISSGKSSDFGDTQYLPDIQQVAGQAV